MTKSDADSSLRFGATLPSTGARSLSANEHRNISRDVRRLSIFGALGLVLVVVAFCLGYFGGHIVDPDIVDQVGGSLGTALAATGALGGAGCLLFGRRLWRTGAVLVAVYLLLDTSLGTLSPNATELPRAITWAVVVAGLLLGNGFIVARTWQRSRLLGRSRKIRFDLAEGEVEVFEGQLGERGSDRVLRRLAAGRAHAKLEHHRLELLPRSGWVVRFDHRPPAEPEVVHVADVAPAQPHAFRTALPQGLVAATEQARLCLRRRSLTPAEREELAAHVRTLRRPYWPAVLVTAAVCVVLFLNVSRGEGWSGLFSGASIAWYLLAAFAYAAYIRRMLAARKLELDRDLRWVVTVDDDTPAGERVPPKLEVLPVSQLAWTENANPAGWRVTQL